MRLEILETNILDQAADAILVPIDGLVQGPKVNVDRQLGAIGHQLMRKYPDAELDQEIADQVTFPIPLGRAAIAEMTDDDMPYEWVVLLSMLPHLGRLDSYTLRRAARSAFAHGLTLCSQSGAKTVVAPLLKGGWRIKEVQAVELMLEVVRQVQNQEGFEQLDVRLCLLSDIELARERATAMGLAPISG